MSHLLPGEQPTIGPDSQLRIEVHAGPLAGKGFPFVESVIAFGRDPENEISLDDAQVSRHHAILRRQDDELILEDLGSTNGTWVNGERIVGPHVLQPTETISIGSSVFGVTGFSAPSTVSMSAQKRGSTGESPWRTYQSSTVYSSSGNQSGGNWLLWSGLILLVMLIVAIVGVSIFVFSTGNRAPASTGVPDVMISSPVNGSEFDVGQQVIVQATGTDVEGVVRMELWVAGQKVTEALSPIATGQTLFTAVMSWTPQVEGSYSVEVRAINSRGNQSAPTTVNLNIAGQVAGASPTPTPQPPTSTAIPSGIPKGVVRTDLNVRSGPGTGYEIVGRIAAETEVEIVGQTADGTWWYIVYLLSDDKRGWIASEYAPSQNAGGVPIVAAPTPTQTNTPLPTETPTPTEKPPTETPTPTQAATSTSAPPTETPMPTATPTLPPDTASISFSADPLLIDEGKCTTFSWLVSNVKAVYFQNEGVPGEAENGQPVKKEMCPTKTTTYELKVVKQNDEVVVNKITITVNRKPEPPSDLKVDKKLENGFELKWDDDSDNEDGFRLYNADSNTVIKTFDANTVSGKTIDLNCGESYRLYLVAFNEIGESKPGNIVTDQTSTCP